MKFAIFIKDWLAKFAILTTTDWKIHDFYQWPNDDFWGSFLRLIAEFRNISASTWRFSDYFLGLTDKILFFFQAIGEIRDVYQWPISKICNFFSPTGWPNLRPFFPITDWQISWYFPWLSEEIYDIYWHNNKICNFFYDWLKKYTIFCRDWLTKLAIFINNSIDEFRNLLRNWLINFAFFLRNLWGVLCDSLKKLIYF